jgi:hypothetical protein
MRKARFTLWVCLMSFAGWAMGQQGDGVLTLTFIDAATGDPTPVRVHVMDESGAFHVASDALMYGGDCDMSDAGAGYNDLPSALAAFTDRLENPYTRTTQFYSEGSATVTVPAGKISVAAFKGPEYSVAYAEIQVQAGETVTSQMQITRWIDLPANGWYSADDHLHIQRPHPDLNPHILKMMQAEDIHVANLLQMGKVRNFQIAPQYAFGDDGHYQRGHYILATGQENPRTHFLGHTITLGAKQPIFNADQYLIYRLIWEESAAQGGLNGFAHAWAENGTSVAPHDGMAVVLPHNVLHFLEVLQFNRSGYEAWYDILNLGFRVAPTAGTDYPCADQNIAGHERFYTRVDGDLTYAKWLDAVRAGRTFVTTGPIAQFRINGQDIGSDIVLPRPGNGSGNGNDSGSVKIEGSVHFDPTRDNVNIVELIQNGQMVRRFSRVEDASSIEFIVDQPVNESSWFALRGYGLEQSYIYAQPFHFGGFNPSSNVHTGAIYVRLQGEPGIGKGTRAKEIASTWLARLDDLEAKLAVSNTDYLAGQIGTPDFDAVPKETLVNNREALLTEIDKARVYFRRIAE